MWTKKRAESGTGRAHAPAIVRDSLCPPGYPRVGMMNAEETASPFGQRLVIALVRV
jgi:hypothetical protein